jgi:hypothetical protein
VGRLIPVVIAFAAILAPAADVSLAERIAIAERQRDEQVLEVRSTRHYTVRNAKWATDATMTVRMITSAGGGKRYEILDTNAEGMRKTILTRILDGEVHAAAKKDRDGNMNSNNYELRPVSTPAAASGGCREYEMVAKKRTRFTFDGKGCVDLNDMAMVRMEGLTTRRMSFLVGRAYVVQEFQKVDDLWYSSLNQSSADVLFLGKTELIIKYSDYSIVRKPSIIAGSK